MYLPALLILHRANIKAGGTGFGDRALSAPQAGLMAMLSQGIVGGQMAWPLVIVGIVMGIAMIMVQVRSPMLFSVGMYLPLETTFAIFVGGLIRGLVNHMAGRRGLQRRAEGAGGERRRAVASGLIAGEALMGLLVAAVVVLKNGRSTSSPLLAARTLVDPGGGGAGALPDLPAARQGGFARRTAAAVGDDVGVKLRPPGRDRDRKTKGVGCRDPTPFLHSWVASSKRRRAGSAPHVGSAILQSGSGGGMFMTWARQQEPWINAPR